MRGVAALLLGAAIALGGCGEAAETSSTAALRLRREDLVAVSHALQALEGPVAREVSATKGAWPLVANGLPMKPVAALPATITNAAASAAAIRTPTLLREAQASTLTGPASPIAGLVQSFSALAATGWKLLGAAIDQFAHGSPGAARFARANAALYIESVYDAHFELAQVGKQLLAGYHQLGGPRAFGRTLSQAEVNALARAYSEPSDRLHPHVGARLGS